MTRTTASSGAPALVRVHVRGFARALALGCLLLPGLALPGIAEAASVKLAGGGSLSVHPAPPRIGNSSLVTGSEALMYTMITSSGNVSAGRIPGTEGALAREIALAQHPLSGDIVMAYSRAGVGGHDISTVTWTGQSWTAPQELAVGAGDERQPLIAFRPGGDAVIAWTTTNITTSVLVRHVDLTLGAGLSTYSFYDLGTLRQLGGDAASVRGVEPQLQAVVGGADSMHAYLLLAEPSGAPLSVARIQLDATVDPGGFGAAPVPVSFIRSATQSASGSGLNGMAGSNLGVGEIFAPWRVVLGNSEAWYWAELDRAVVVPLIGRAPLAPITLELPETEALLHVAAFRAARVALGADLRRPSVPDVPLARRGR